MKIMNSLTLSAVMLAASSTQIQAASFTDGFYLKANTSYIDKQDNKDSTDEKLETTKSGIEVGTDYFDIGFQRTQYKLHEDNWFAKTKSSYNARKVYADAKYFGEIDSTWNYFVSAGIGSNYADGGLKFNKNYHYRFAAFASRVINSDWSVDLGVAGAINKVGIQPIPVISFKYGDEKAPGFSFKVGLPYNEVAYRFNDIVSVKTSLEATDDIYGTDNGYYGHNYIRDRYFSLNASVLAELNGFYGELGAGYIFNREFRTYDDKGDKYGDKIKFKNEAGVFLNLGYRY